MTAKTRPTSTAAEWRTRVTSEWTARYGVNELHAVFFEPDDDRPGMRFTVIVADPGDPPPTN